MKRYYTQEELEQACIRAYDNALGGVDRYYGVEAAIEGAQPSLTLPDHGEAWEPMAVLEIESRKVNEWGVQWAYIAMDEDGCWFVFSGMPSAKTSIWSYTEGFEKQINQPIRYSGDWKDSLHSIEP